MIPVDQTRFGYPEGNCLMACVASIMELGLADLPDLHAECEEWDEEAGAWKPAGDWFAVLQEAVQARGWHAVWIDNELRDVAPMGLAIAGGPSPREGTVREGGENAGHVVVTLDGRVVHDPHPSRAGLGGPVDSWIVLLPPAGWRPR